MENLSDAECKVLLSYNKRTGLLIGLAENLMGEPKKLKLCASLIKKERKSLSSSKSAVSAEEMREIFWLYDGLIETVDTLRKTKDAVKYGKACEKLENLKAEIANEEALLKLRLGIKELTETEENLLNKIKDSARRAGSFIGDTVSKLKKTIKGESSE